MGNGTFNYHAIDYSAVEFHFHKFDFRLGAKWEYYHVGDMLTNIHYDEVRNLTSVANERNYSYYARTRFDTENDWCFPTRGSFFKAGFAYYTDNLATYNDHIGFMPSSVHPFLLAVVWQYNPVPSDVCFLVPTFIVCKVT